MKISIITPCTRINNLPMIYQSILDDVSYFDLEWIVVYDSNEIDDRILLYEKSSVPIRLLNIKSVDGDSTASRQRNLGLEVSEGDYVYYLDDDNLLYRELFYKLRNYYDNKKLLIVNQFSNIQKTYRLKKFNPDTIKSVIDTAQILVPKKYKYIKWDNTEKYFDEAPYIEKILNECGDDYLFIDRAYSYYNFLRRFSY